MLRSAIAGDEPAIAGFLERHAETSMFLRSNLHRFGLFDRSSPNGTAYWLAETNGDITAVFGLSNAGMVMSEAPAAAPELWQSVAHALDGQSISGIAGEVSQVAQAKQALGLHSAAFGMDSPEPLYKLSLDALILPDQPGEVRVATEADRPRSKSGSGRTSPSFTWPRPNAPRPRRAAGRPGRSPPARRASCSSMASRSR